MAIDPTVERLIPLRDAAVHFPRPGGKKSSLPALYRLASQRRTDAGKPRLETVVVGALLCTSTDAIKRFVEESTAHREGRATAPKPAAVAAMDIERTSRELDVIGV